MTIIPAAQLAIEKLLKIFHPAVFFGSAGEAQTTKELDCTKHDIYIFIQQPTTIINGRSLFGANHSDGPYRFKASTMQRVLRTNGRGPVSVICFNLDSKDKRCALSGRLEIPEHALEETELHDFIDSVFYTAAAPFECLYVSVQVAGYDPDFFR